MRVLVVDDVPDNVELVCEILEGEYEVIRAYNGADAVKLAMAEHPHIIILDVRGCGPRKCRESQKFRSGLYCEGL